MAKKKEELMEENEVVVAGEIETITEEFMEEEELMEQDGKDEIFPMGPTYDQLADWKSRYKEEVYMSDFVSQVFIWRPLRRSEWKTMQRAQGHDEAYNEESICRTCILWPEDYANHEMAFGKAGIPTMLSQLIMEQSGFSRAATVRL